MSDLDKNYWANRYLTGDTGWDAGAATPPIVHYFETVRDKNVRILIPGAGNGHEAEHLFAQGFRNVYLCDWAEQPLKAFTDRLPAFPPRQLLCSDFFELDLPPFDYIVEQTFFCALPPTLRPAYAQKMARLLAPTGKLVGLLFSFPLSAEGPPFGGSRSEYESLFAPHFANLSIEPCTNSIKPRLGNEFWIELGAPRIHR